MEAGVFERRGKGGYRVEGEKVGEADPGLADLTWTDPTPYIPQPIILPCQNT